MKLVTWCTENGMQQLHSIFNVSMVMDMRNCGVSIYIHNLITEQNYYGWQAEKDF